MRTARICVPLILATLLSGCPDEPYTANAPNTPPTIVLNSPELNEDGSPPAFPEDEAIVFNGEALDAEDPPATLSINWTALQTDVSGVDTIDLGQTTPDSTGVTQLVVGTLTAGSWTITATVTDTDGASDTANQPVVVLPVNDPPQVAITSPGTGDDFVEGESISFVGTAFDDNGAANLDITWSSDVAGTLNALPPDDSGLLTFSFAALTVGEHNITLTATDAGELSATDAITIEILDQDLPPTTPTVDVVPDDPLTDDDLICLVTVAPTDPEGEPVTLTYLWLVNGVPAGVDSPSLSSTQTEAGHEWTCEVFGHDGTEAGSAGSDSVTIGNTPPSISGVTLSPDPAYETDSLLCAASGWSDADGDTEFFSYAWLVDGSPIAATGDTLSGTAFDKGDDVQCEVTPEDGTDTGPTLASNAVPILNTPPTDPAVTVTPSPVAALTDALACMATGSTDPDPADSVISLVQWLIDGTHEPAWDGSWVIPWSDTELGQEWTCQAWSTDAEDSSAVVSATTTVLPGASDVVITEFLAAPVATPDVNGEWVEVYNATGLTLNLLGFVLHDDGGDSHVINDDLLVGPGDYAILARNDDVATNGGVPAAYEYADFVLDDDADEIVLTFDNVEVDRVAYDGGTFDWSLSLASASLDPDPGAPDAALNDDPASWCASSSLIDGFGTDFGTPGLPNDTCACGATDGDGDGFGTDGSCLLVDCDDTDDLVSPGVPEVCNGVDDNCVDGIDEGCNDAPTVDSALLGPDPAWEDTTLTCEGVNWEDLDGDPENYLYEWYVQSALVVAATGNTLTGASFDKNDPVLCKITPDDGEDTGPQVSSNTVFISNSAPSDPTVSLAPSPTALLTDDLTCGATGSTDIDPVDTVSYVVSWTIDGIPEPSWDGQWTIPASETRLGEEWTCEVQATDTFDPSGTVSRSTTVLPSPGDLVISEVMVNPTTVSDGAGEWFELFNAAPHAIDLLGFTLADDTGDTHTITDSISVAPGAYVVLARNGDFALNGGVVADYDYSGVTLSNGEDQLVLLFDTVEVDRVEFDVDLYTNSLTGTSLSLDPDLGAPDAIENDDPANWCGATTALTSPGSDFGTPGQANDTCTCWDSDNDADNYGDDVTCATIDCDDGNPAINVEGDDVCENSVDEDCSGSDAVCDCLATDDDGDGFGDGLACSPVDCNDNDPAISPAATEVCDGIDNDCDGVVDDGFDLDGDGWTTCDDDCDDSDPDVNPDEVEVCNGIDDDCDVLVDEGYDNDLDGWTICAGDCNDGDAAISPGAPEACDGEDDDCDGIIDDGFDLDGDGWTTCAGDCNDSNNAINPAISESCNFVDDDCDGSVDEGFDLDGDGWSTCNGDCNDSNSNINPGEAEVCDGIDQDCGGGPDDGPAAAMCPPTYQVQSTACSGGSCAVTVCSGGFFDVDTVYSTGCECADEGFGNTCGSAANQGSFFNGDNQNITGKLPVSNQVDWIQVTFPSNSSRPGGGTPHVHFVSNPQGSHKFDVYLNCGGSQSSCGDAPDSLGLTEWNFTDNQPSAFSSNGNPWPENVFIRVYRTSAGNLCQSYVLNVSR